jgi:diadenosine tetraphosphate (Ap4A) HIT family hydrolase
MLQPRAHLDLTDLDDDLATELGVLTVRIARAAGELPDVARVHVNKWGDGAEHLHVFFLGRPVGLQQLRGSNLALWEEMLPRVPEAKSTAALQHVAAQLG